MTNSTPIGRPQLTGEPAEDRRGHHFRIALTGREGEGRHALVDAEGLEALHKAGARSLYVVGDARGRQYVVFTPRAEAPITAARAILSDPKGQRVQYVNGDRFDLRAANLYARSYLEVGESRITTHTYAL